MQPNILFLHKRLLVLYWPAVANQYRSWPVKISIFPNMWFRPAVCALVFAALSPVSGVSDAGIGLRDAVMRGDEAGVRAVLVADPGSVDARDKNGETALHAAAAQGNAAGARILVEAGADIDARETRAGATPLLLAVVNGRDDAAKYLAAAGADVNIASFNGLSPLHAAVFRNSPALAGILLGRGADLHARSESGLTPLQLAVRRGQREMTGALIRAAVTGEIPPALPAASVAQEAISRPAAGTEAIERELAFARERIADLEKLFLEKELAARVELHAAHEAVALAEQRRNLAQESAERAAIEAELLRDAADEMRGKLEPLTALLSDALEKAAGADKAKAEIEAALKNEVSARLSAEERVKTLALSLAAVQADLMEHGKTAAEAKNRAAAMEAETADLRIMLSETLRRADSFEKALASEKSRAAQSVSESAARIADLRQTLETYKTRAASLQGEFDAAKQKWAAAEKNYKERAAAAASEIESAKKEKEAGIARAGAEFQDRLNTLSAALESARKAADEEAAGVKMRLSQLTERSAEWERRALSAESELAAMRAGFEKRVSDMAGQLAEANAKLAESEARPAGMPGIPAGNAAGATPEPALSETMLRIMALERNMDDERQGYEETISGLNKEIEALTAALLDEPEDIEAGLQPAAAAVEPDSAESFRARSLEMERDYRKEFEPAREDFAALEALSLEDESLRKNAGSLSPRLKAELQDR